MRTRYLEPRTDVAAAEDWSTELILADERINVRMSRVIMLVCLLLTVSAAGLAPASVGGVGAVVLLALVTAFYALALLLWTQRRRRHGRLLRVPWRRYSAAVVATDDGALFDRLAVFDDARTIVVRGLLEGAPSVVSHRQELFLGGPDETGRVAIRVAGLCRLFTARLSPGAWRPQEREILLGTRPMDDPEVIRAFRGFRWGRRAWVWPAVVAVIGTVELLLSVKPLAPAGIVVGALLLAVASVTAPMAVVLGQWYGRAIEAVLAATSWTPVPVTLFPWELDGEVAGLAQLPSGTAFVRLPLGNLDIIANIADTGTMWIVGDPGEVFAIGVPRVPVLTLGLLNEDRHEPIERPQPLMLATKTVLRGFPVLRR